MSLYVIANEVTLYPKGKQSPKGEIAASLRSSQGHHCEVFMPLTSRQKILDYLKRNRIASSQEVARGYSLTIASPNITPRGALLLGERKIAVTPFQGKLRITGRLEIGEMSTTPNPRWLARIESAAREYLRLDETLKIEETWAGLRPSAPDGLPIIGCTPRYENLLLAAVMPCSASRSRRGPGRLWQTWQMARNRDSTCARSGCDGKKKLIFDTVSLPQRLSVTLRESVFHHTLES